MSFRPKFNVKSTFRYKEYRISTSLSVFCLPRWRRTRGRQPNFRVSFGESNSIIENLEAFFSIEILLSRTTFNGRNNFVSGIRKPTKQRRERIWFLSWISYWHFPIHRCTVSDSRLEQQFQKENTRRYDSYSLVWDLEQFLKIEYYWKPTFVVCHFRRWGFFDCYFGTRLRRWNAFGGEVLLATADLVRHTTQMTSDTDTRPTSPRFSRFRIRWL